MATVTPPPTTLPFQVRVYLPGVSYATYDRLITEIEGRHRLRVTYHHREKGNQKKNPRHRRGLYR